jgi:hypothetical protein
MFLSYFGYGTARLVADQIAFLGVPAIKSATVRDFVFQACLSAGIFWEGIAQFVCLDKLLKEIPFFTGAGHQNELNNAKNNRDRINILQKTKNRLSIQGGISIVCCALLCAYDLYQWANLTMGRNNDISNYLSPMISILLSQGKVLLLLAGNKMLQNADILQGEILEIEHQTAKNDWDIQENNNIAMRNIGYSNIDMSAENDNTRLQPSGIQETRLPLIERTVTITQSTPNLNGNNPPNHRNIDLSALLGLEKITTSRGNYISTDI